MSRDQDTVEVEGIHSISDSTRRQWHHPFRRRVASLNGRTLVPEQSGDCSGPTDRGGRMAEGGVDDDADDDLVGFSLEAVSLHR